MSEGAIVFVFLILGGSMLAQWCAWRFRVPATVLLFFLGLIYGPGLELLDPSKMFGAHFHQLASLAVALIVFEGGLALDFKQLREVGEGVARLTIVALPINFVLSSLAAHYIGQFHWGASFLFGSIVVVTGPTVVMPLLRQAKLKPRISAFLRWEAIVNDPVGAILATMVMQLLLLQPGQGTDMALFTIILRMGMSAIIVSILAVLVAWCLRWLCMRDLLPELIKMPLFITLALMLFVVGNLGMEGAGLIASTVFGIALTNMHIPGMSALHRMKESLVVLIVSVLFILLTADLKRGDIAMISWQMIALTVATLFLTRPLGIWLATMNSSLCKRERIFMGWIAPRGIVAASVAGVCGTQLRSVGVPDASCVMPAVFTVIASTMILHGFSLRPLGRRLRLTFPAQSGVAIVGVNSWSLKLARSIHELRIPVLMVDNNVSFLQEARKEKIPTLCTQILSEDGAETLEERPADYLIVTTSDPIYNGLVCSHLAPNCGQQRVYQVSPGGRYLGSDQGLSRDARGKILGKSSWNYTLLETLSDQGWRFVNREITADNQDNFLHDHSDFLVFLIVQKNGGISIMSPEDNVPLSFSQGDIAIGFEPPQKRDKQV